MHSSTIAIAPATMTKDEAARYVGISRASLDRRIAAGDGPAVCRLGGRILFRATDLDVWIAAHVVAAA